MFVKFQSKGFKTGKLSSGKKTVTDLKFIGQLSPNDRTKRLVYFLSKIAAAICLF